MQVRHPIDGVHSQAEAVCLVADGQLERGVDVSLLLIAAHVQVHAAGPLVGQAVHEPGVAMEVEDDGLVGGEEGDPFSVREAVWVVGVRDELEEVDHVDAADLELGEVLQQQVDGGEGLVGWDVAARRHHEVRFLAGVGAELWPYADALGAMHDRLLHRKILEVLLFIGDNDIDIVGRPEAVVHDREEAVTVRWKVDADDLGALVGHDIKETWVLVCEAVVVLSPNHGR